MAAKRKASAMLHKEPIAPSTVLEPEVQIDEAYTGLMKDADKLKLMLLAWNYQNSNAGKVSHNNSGCVQQDDQPTMQLTRNGTEGPDLNMVGGLWAQYQNALALNVTKPESSSPRQDQPSPLENQDETNSSGQKDDDDGSEDESDDRLDQTAHDPERLKAFNMFVRLFVDENLDRMIPISKQPKEKIQAIIDSCTRQFPEFAERARKRIRTYLKSCRRNKKTREGWETTVRPTPAHLTSVQAEQILAMACENESMNAKRMRIGLDPISQAMPASVNSTSEVTAPSSSFLNVKSEAETVQASTVTTSTKGGIVSSMSDIKPFSSSINNGTTSTVTSGNQMFRNDSTVYPARTQPYPAFNFSQSAMTTNAPTDLSMNKGSSQIPNTQQQPQIQSTTAPQQQQQITLQPQQHSSPMLQQQQQQQPQQQQPLALAQQLQQQQTQQPQQQQQQPPPPQRPPILTHKLNASEISAVRQLVTGYRESAAFLLRSADELEQLLLQQQ